MRCHYVLLFCYYRCTRTTTAVLVQQCYPTAARCIIDSIAATQIGVRSYMAQNTPCVCTDPAYPTGYSFAACCVYPTPPLQGSTAIHILISGRVLWRGWHLQTRGWHRPNSYLVSVFRIKRYFYRSTASTPIYPCLLFVLYTRYLCGHDHDDRGANVHYNAI